MAADRISPWHRMTRPALGDMNGDGQADLIVLLDDGTARLFLNNGTSMPFAGHGSANFLGMAAPAGTSIAMGDINQDGLPDVLLADSGRPHLGVSQQRQWWILPPKQSLGWQLSGLCRGPHAGRGGSGRRWRPGSHRRSGQWRRDRPARSERGPADRIDRHARRKLDPARLGCELAIAHPRLLRLSGVHSGRPVGQAGARLRAVAELPRHAGGSCGAELLPRQRRELLFPARKLGATGGGEPAFGPRRSPRPAR